MAAQSKAKLMRKTRANRKAAGLVEFREWVTPAERLMLQRELDRHRRFMRSDLPIQA